MFTARAAIHNQDAGGLALGSMFMLRLPYRLAGCEPFDRKLIVRIGKLLARLSCDRAFAALRIAFPSDLGDLIDFLAKLGERWICELLEEAVAKVLLIELGRRHPFAGVRSAGHVKLTQSGGHVSDRIGVRTLTA